MRRRRGGISPWSLRQEEEVGLIMSLADSLWYSQNERLKALSKGEFLIEINRSGSKEKD